MDLGVSLVSSRKNRDRVLDSNPTRGCVLGRDERVDLEHWETPAWAAARCVEHYFPDLSEQDLVLDIGTGKGRFLSAIPRHVPAFGIEIERRLADFATDDTGRDVLCGDFLTMEIPKPTVILGNPPWSVEFVTAALRLAPCA